MASCGAPDQATGYRAAPLLRWASPQSGMPPTGDTGLLGLRLPKLLAGWARIDILVLGGLGLRPLTAAQAADLLEVIEDRHGRIPPQTRPMPIRQRNTNEPPHQPTPSRMTLPDWDL